VRSHRVRQGECLSSIAGKYGQSPEIIWHHVDNKALKALRKTPDVLLAGDILKIPSIEQKKINCATDGKHSFVRLGGPYLHINLSVNNESIAGEPYELWVDGRSQAGNIGNDGKIDARIPIGATTGYIVALGRRFDFGLGDLDPIDTTTGAQARLNQLGFAAGAVDNDLGDKTKASISAFQTANGLDATGELDEATRDKLKNEYGT
jgi:hypothetical protein